MTQPLLISWWLLLDPPVRRGMVLYVAIQAWWEEGGVVWDETRDLSGWVMGINDGFYPCFYWLMYGDEWWVLLANELIMVVNVGWKTVPGWDHSQRGWEGGSIIIRCPVSLAIGWGRQTWDFWWHHQLTQEVGCSNMSKFLNRSSNWRKSLLLLRCLLLLAQFLPQAKTRVTFFNPWARPQVYTSWVPHLG